MRTPRTTFRRSPKRTHRSERGSALVIALLVVLALTAMGMVGLRQTSSELRTSANARYNTQAQHVSNSVLTAAVERVGANGQTIWTFIQRACEQREIAAIADGNGGLGELVGNGGVCPRNTPLLNIAPADVLQEGSLQVDSPQKLTESRVDSMVREQNSQIAGNVQITDPQDGPKAPGFSANFCFKRVRLESTGNPGSNHAVVNNNVQNDGNGGTLEPNLVNRNTTSRHVAYALLGPLDCSNGYYNN